MSKNSSVSPISTEGAADQRNKAEEEKKKEELPLKFEEGKENSHQAHDPKDQRSIANRLAAAEDQNDGTSSKTKSAETQAGEIDPTAPARMHGNEPSRGAKIDKKIADEEEEIIRKMDEAKAQKQANK